MAAAVLVLAPAALAGAQTGKGGQQNMAAVRSHLKAWPKASREAAEYMMKNSQRRLDQVARQRSSGLHSKAGPCGEGYGLVFNLRLGQS